MIRNVSSIIFILLFFANFVKFQYVKADNYNYKTYRPNNTNYGSEFDKNSKVLFIVDFSNSMNEKLGTSSKLAQAVETLEELLPQIPPSVQVGLRVYGYRAGLTYMDGCTASKLVVPLGVNNTMNVRDALYKTSAVGWTPITYSLKQAVNKDFAGITGKKKIILLTDGGENCDESPCSYVIELMRTREDVSIDVIAFDIYNAEANNQLKCTAYTTSGKFYNANTKSQLMESLSDSLNIDKSVTGKVKVHE